MVLDAEVVDHQDKSDWASGVTEETRGLGLVEVEALEEGDKTKIGQLTCSLRPYIVFSMRKIMYGFPALSCLMKGKRERRDKTAGEKRLVYILRNWGEARGDSR